MTPAIGRARHDLLAAFLLLTSLPLLGVALAFVGTVPCCPSRKVEKARLDLCLLARSLEQYMLHRSFLPRSGVGLRALVDAGVIEGIPKDPWGHEYRYELGGASVRISTLGADGAPGGQEDDADIAVWFVLRPEPERSGWWGPEVWPPAFGSVRVRPGPGW